MPKSDGGAAHVGGGTKCCSPTRRPDIVEPCCRGTTAYTPATDTSRAALEKSLETIRRTGSTEMGDLDPAAFSIAARGARSFPGRDRRAQIAGPMTRLDAARQSATRRWWSTTPSACRAELGWSGASRIAGGASMFRYDDTVLLEETT